MTEDGVTLSGKALVFVLEAVRFHAAHFELVGDDATLDDDTRADAGNDAMFLRAIAQDMAGAERARRERLLEG